MDPRARIMHQIPRRRINPDEVWDPHYHEVRQLYLEHQPPLSLKQLMEHFRDKYSFSPSQKQWKSRLSKWQVQRGMNSRTAAVILHLLQEAEVQGISRHVFFNGREKTIPDVRQYITRSKSVDNEVQLLQHLPDQREWPSSVAWRDGLSALELPQTMTVEELYNPLAAIDPAIRHVANATSIFVDSGYGGSEDKAADVVAAQTADDSTTEYSAASASDRQYDDYVQCLAEDLYDRLCTDAGGTVDFASLSDTLPALLQRFALRLGHEGHSRAALEVMYFVHKKRSDVTRKLIARSEAVDYEEERPDRDSAPDVAFIEKVNAWLAKIDADAESEAIPEDEDLATGLEPLHSSQDVQKYRTLVSTSSSYRWLLSDISRELCLTCPGKDARSVVQTTILQSLPDRGKISYRQRPQDVSITFLLNWDLELFFDLEKYDGSLSDVLAKAVTLTGESTYAQALPCAEYLKQVWPMSSTVLISLLRKVVEQGNCNQVTDFLADGTRVLLSRENADITLTVTGSHFSIVEVGEQLAWISSALQSSGYDDGMTTCTPYAHIMTDPGVDPGRTDGVLSRVRIGSSRPIKLETSVLQSGQCWHNMFRNPVIVQGYPVLKRLVPDSGLEAPLDLIAALIRVKRPQAFDNSVYLKGFSSMLVPSLAENGHIFWHTFYNSDGSHICYSASGIKAVEGLDYYQINDSRHIVGWCSAAQNITGHPRAQFDIHPSSLGKPGPACVLDKITISAGKFGFGGSVSFLLGEKDKPLYLPPSDYIECLHTASMRYFVLWDSEERRGWLVNGSAVLLHLVRASLKVDEDGILGRKLASKHTDIYEPVLEPGEDYATAVLSDERNMVLPIFPGKLEVDSQAYPASSAGPAFQSEPLMKRRYSLLQDRVELIWAAIEKVMARQEQKKPQIKAQIRQRIEGWDFCDLTSRRHVLEPREDILQHSQSGWVDFVRSIGAVVLFGQGFGNLIEPRTQDSPSSPRSVCHCWEQVPRDQCYLTACVRDLQRIMKIEGSREDGRSGQRELCRDVVWHSPRARSTACPCNIGPARDPAECVQVLYPPSVWHKFRSRKSVEMHADGAVIFGHNPSFKLWFPNSGDPELSDQPLEPALGEESLPSDSSLSSVATNPQSSSPSRVFSDGLGPTSQHGADTLSGVQTSDTSLSQDAGRRNDTSVEDRFSSHEGMDGKTRSFKTRKRRHGDEKAGKKGIFNITHRMKRRKLV